jgi:hypothetical protein
MRARLTRTIVLAGALAATGLAGLPGASPASPAGAGAASQSASSGDVAATFAYTTQPGGFGNTYANETLTIARAGTTAYSKPVADPSCPCEPGTAGPKSSPSLQVVDLDHSGEPNVVLNLYTGGAHCCTIAQVFSYDAASGGYTETSHDFADPAFKLEQLSPGGEFRFVTADARFEYQFTSFAESGVPLQIDALANGAVVDVTRAYPLLIKQNAGMWWRLFVKYRSHDAGVGPISAWAADEENLGRDAYVQMTLRRQLRAGHLNNPGVGNKGGAAFVRALGRLLRKLGYTRHG